MKTVIIVALAIMLSSCGAFERSVASWTGWSRICVEGVSYLQFTSGVSVEYTKEGKIKTCS